MIPDSCRNRFSDRDDPVADSLRIFPLFAPEPGGGGSDIRSSI